MGLKLLKDIRRLLGSPFEFKICHIFQEGNRSDDMSANISIAKQLDIRLCLQPPRELFHILFSDKVSIIDFTL